MGFEITSDTLTKEEIKYIHDKVDRAFRIDKIRRIKKLKKWLKFHRN